jgi:UrcA family protein
MKQTLKIILGSALATAAIIKSVPALAEAAPAQNVSVVRTADLDLSTNAGRNALDRRLVIAAGEVCDTASDSDLARKNHARQCRKDVLAEARAKTGAIVAGRAAERSILIAAR